MNSISALSQSERMFAVYAVYGKAMFAAHCLERKLALLLIFSVTNEVLSKSTKDQKIAKIDRMTLGSLIEDFSLVYAPPEDLLEELDNMLYFRNHLTHRISGSITHAATKLQCESEVILELSDWAEMMIETEKLLDPYTMKWIQKHGFDMKQIMEKMLQFYPGVRREEQARYPNVNGPPAH